MGFIRRWLFGVAVAGATTLSMFAPAEVRADGLRRFALIAGNDRGGPGTRRLLYAREDARKVWGILTRLGGVAPADATLLLDAGAGELWSSLGELERRARDAAGRGERTALVVYYSGHAKDGTLRLGDTQVGVEALKARLAGAPFDVRIGIFDACQSGALTRRKGARKAPAFEVDSRDLPRARGLVILTSSAADEDSQESDLIGGSYFSHHLASGLLGGADKSGDGRVTLSEAYAYAHDRTVADTVDSAAGAQHPTFSYELAGNGDLVLTDVAAHREGVVFPGTAPPGTYFLVDGKGFVAAEIQKVQGAERRIALAPGRYRVKRRLPDRLRIGEIDVPRGAVVALVETALRDAPFSDDPVKGVEAVATTSVAHWSLAVGGGVQTVFRAPSADLFPAAGILGAEVALRDFFRRDWIWAFELGAGGARSQVVLPSATLPYDFSQLTLASSLLAELPRLSIGPLEPFIGFRVALLLMTRRFDQAVLPEQFFATVSPGLVGGVTWRVADAWALLGRARVHYLLYNVDDSNHSLGTWDATLLLQYDFGGER